MQPPECPLCAQEMAQEEVRLNKLEKLFHKLIRRERAQKEREAAGESYEKSYSGLSFVTEVKPWALSLESDDGEVITPLQIDPSIAKLVEIDDGIVLQAKFRAGAWRITGYEWAAHYQFEEVNYDLSDEEFEKQTLEAEKEWEQRRQTNAQKNNGDCGLH